MANGSGFQGHPEKIKKQHVRNDGFQQAKVMQQQTKMRKAQEMQQSKLWNCGDLLFLLLLCSCCGCSCDC